MVSHQESSHSGNRMLFPSVHPRRCRTSGFVHSHYTLASTVGFHKVSSLESLCPESRAAYASLARCPEAAPFPVQKQFAVDIRNATTCPRASPAFPVGVG